MRFHRVIGPIFHYLVQTFAHKAKRRRPLRGQASSSGRAVSLQEKNSATGSIIDTDTRAFGWTLSLIALIRLQRSRSSPAICGLVERVTNCRRRYRGVTRRLLERISDLLLALLSTPLYSNITSDSADRRHADLSSEFNALLRRRLSSRVTSFSVSCSCNGRIYVSS